MLRCTPGWVAGGETRTVCTYPGQSSWAQETLIMRDCCDDYYRGKLKVSGDWKMRRLGGLAGCICEGGGWRLGRAHTPKEPWGKERHRSQCRNLDLVPISEHLRQPWADHSNGSIGKWPEWVQTWEQIQVGWRDWGKCTGRKDRGAGALFPVWKCTLARLESSWRRREGREAKGWPNQASVSYSRPLPSILPSPAPFITLVRKL